MIAECFCLLAGLGCKIFENCLPLCLSIYSLLTVQVQLGISGLWFSEASPSRKTKEEHLLWNQSQGKRANFIIRDHHPPPSCPSHKRWNSSNILSFPNNTLKLNHADIFNAFYFFCGGDIIIFIVQRLLTAVLGEPCRAGGQTQGSYNFCMWNMVFIPLNYLPGSTLLWPIYFPAFLREWNMFWNVHFAL